MAATAPRPGVLDELADRALAGDFGADPADDTITSAFVTTQAVRHAGRSGGYRNRVLSLRLEAAVGSCAVEPGPPPEASPSAGGAGEPGAAGEAAGDEEVAAGCVGVSVAELLKHPTAAVRTAALDAFLMHHLPHGPAQGARSVRVPAGSTLAKSTARARAVAELLPVPPGATVLVVGVVNSLLHALRARGLRYLPCDLKGGTTEWGEAVLTDADAHLDRCDALLVTGMTLGNGSADRLLAHARATGKPLVAFAQTGSAVWPRLIGSGVTAVSAEPYPFFWLDGGPSTLHLYRGGDR
nr:DUF364 domain-containing protein [Allostreptomyces psammosilenae]